jgi:hypothetical protein
MERALSAMGAELARGHFGFLPYVGMRRKRQQRPVVRAVKVLRISVPRQGCKASRSAFSEWATTTVRQGSGL